MRVRLRAAALSLIVILAASTCVHAQDANKPIRLAVDLREVVGALRI